MLRTRLLSVFIVILMPVAVFAGDIVNSTISSVKLYQNQAEITRVTRVKLNKGENSVIVGGLPRGLYDWSVKGRLPGNYAGRIMSVEVEQKALIDKRQRNILEIEKKLDKLRERDAEFLDGLKNLKSQQAFLNSVTSFTNIEASKELRTRIPQLKVWDETLRYVSKKQMSLFSARRGIEKKREELGKEIQKLEFELSQIAGSGYFRTYRNLNTAIMQNRAALKVQQFAGTTKDYGNRKILLRKPGAGKVDIEKRVIISIFSSIASETDISVTYLIPETNWQMVYDVRASREKGDLTMVVFANVFQKTTEDWNDVKLSLSTGSPVNAIQPPVLGPWFLELVQPPAPQRGRVYKKEAPSGAEMEDLIQMMPQSQKAGEPIPEAPVSERGPYMEIGLPLRQTIASSAKYQKKYVKEFKMKGRDVEFYYELIPEHVRNGFLNVKILNTTSLPWLYGEAQIFLENEFMGKARVPFTPKGKKEKLTIGMETRLSSKKELVKKYEDTSGIFGGKRRIVYSFKITVESDMPGETAVEVFDRIPVSRNEKISTEIANLSLAFTSDEEFEKSTEYGRGIRKWRLNMAPNQKKEITYDAVISFDKDVSVRGLK